MGKDFDDGTDQKQKEKAEAEDEMVRQHHQLSGHKFEQTVGDRRGQRSFPVESLTPLKMLRMEEAVFL